MKLVKSLLLGSAAGLSAVAGAQAADLPVKKAAPVEYVRVCSAYGAGFFYIPGTDTCLRVSGRARLDVGYIQSFSRTGQNGDLTAFRGLGRLNVDARTQTGYGTLRTFIRYDIAYATGNYLTSGTAQRVARAFPALGVDQFGRAQTQVILDKAFIQFAGLTAGRAASFFDFYAHDFEIMGGTLGSDVSDTNLLAYTATFGQGFSATISLEDPTRRRNPLFGNAATAAAPAGQFSNVFSATGQANLSPTIGRTLAGAPALAFEDLTQRERLPDFVGALRYDAPWGSAQLSAAVHEISVGQSTFATNLAGTVQFNNGTVIAPRPANAYGFAVQGGLKINTPFIAAGDALYLQGAYGQGAEYYTGYSNYTATYVPNANPIQGGEFTQYYPDAVLNPFTGRLELSESFTVTASYLHYWSPEFRSAFFGSYGEWHTPKAATAGVQAIGFNFGTGALGTPINAGAAAFNATLRDNNQLVAGASLIWSPVRDLDIGLEGLYTRIALNNGRTADVNKQPGAVITGVNAAGVPIGNFGGNVGVPIKTVNSEDTFQLRFRVQRDF